MNLEQFPGVRQEKELYHGSPYSFEQFSAEHIGTGEGGKVYGVGIYLTEEKEVADVYANYKNRHSLLRFFRKKGSTYKIDVLKEHPDWLVWDAPISDEQVEKITAQLQRQNLSIDEASYRNLVSTIENKSIGKMIYKSLTSLTGSDKHASELLSKAGIDGVKYRTDDIPEKYEEYKHSSNYVVFDPSIVGIRKT